MKRKIYKELLDWKNSKNRKPLILDGARQVGKTWILKEFGKNEYKNVAYLNCDKEISLKTIFYDFDIPRLIRALSSISSVNIEKENTLIILDEIQELPIALTSLKYFCEEANEYHVIVAGSLLGLSLHEGTGFPVGKIDELKMYPMTFLEFIEASEGEILAGMLQNGSMEEISSLSMMFSDLLRQYYYVGGMPEVVSRYIENQDLSEVRKIQKNILRDYELDFSKHIPSSLLSKVRMVFNSIPSQLSKENKKFIYSALKKGARGKEFEDAIEWLLKAGLIHKITRVKKIEKPLKFYEDNNSFKIFFLDLGLLGAMVDVQASEVLLKENYFSEYKGSFTEQFVAQEMIASGEIPYYYSKENSTLEIDMLLQKKNLYAIEVKAEENVKSKSLKTVYDYGDIVAIRMSMRGYKKQDWVENIPLYACFKWIQLIKKM